MCEPRDHVEPQDCVGPREHVEPQDYVGPRDHVEPQDYIGPRGQVEPQDYVGPQAHAQRLRQLPLSQFWLLLKDLESTKFEFLVCHNIRLMLD